jgi:hypothetical protein
MSSSRRSRSNSRKEIVENHLEFLHEEPYDDQVSLGNGIAAFVPEDFYEFNLEEVQHMADEESKSGGKIPKPSISNSGKPYCGSNPIVQKWTLYYMKYGLDEEHPHYGFENPFHYAKIASPAEAFQIGKNLSTVNNYLFQLHLQSEEAIAIAIVINKLNKGNQLFFIYYLI